MRPRHLVLALIAVALPALSGCASPVPSSMGVAGEVVDEGSAPLSDCTVLASGLDSQPVPEMAAVTDDDGEFHWTLPATGGYLLTAHCGAGTGSIEVEITTDRPVPEVTIPVASRAHEEQR